jgi:hypothetical protein
MPQFVVERQYLVPMYQHLVVAAETFDAACELAVSDDIAWDSQEMDCDNARATTLTAINAIPDGYEVDSVQHVLITGTDPSSSPLDRLSLANLLYENAAETGPLLDIPAKFTDDE